MGTTISTLSPIVKHYHTDCPLTHVTNFGSMTFSYVCMQQLEADICSHALAWCYVCCLWSQVVTYSWSLWLKLSASHQTAAWCCHVKWQVLTIRGRTRSCGQSDLNWHLVTRMGLKLTLCLHWTSHSEARVVMLWSSTETTALSPWI